MSSTLRRIERYSPVVLMSLAAAVTAPFLVVTAVQGGWLAVGLVLLLLAATWALIAHALARPFYAVKLLAVAVGVLACFGAVFAQWPVVPSGTGTVVAVGTVAIGLAAAFLGRNRRVAAGRLLVAVAAVAASDWLLFVYLHPQGDPGALALVGPAGAAGLAALLAGVVLLVSPDEASAGLVVPAPPRAT